MHMVNDSRPFDVASDEDLLASNFDRISKILGNHEQLPDFAGSRPSSPPLLPQEIESFTDYR